MRLQLYKTLSALGNKFVKCVAREVLLTKSTAIMRSPGLK